MMTVTLASCNKAVESLPDVTTVATTAPVTTTTAPETTTAAATVTPATTVPPPVTTAAPVTTKKAITTIETTTAPPETLPPKGKYDPKNLSFFTDKASYKNDEIATVSLRNSSYDSLSFGKQCPLYYFNGEVWVQPKWIIDGSLGESAWTMFTKDSGDFKFVCDFKKNFGALPKGKYRFEIVVSWEDLMDDSVDRDVFLIAGFEIVE